MSARRRDDPGALLKLRLLGAAEFSESDSRELGALLAQPKALGLLVFLALAPPPRYRRRDTIAALFWPEQDQAHARGALRRTLYVLRDALGSEVLISRGAEEVGVDDTHLITDVAVFDQAMADGLWSEALHLYRGELLAGYFVPAASPEIDQWLDEERRRVRHAARDAAARLAEQELGLGNVAGAAEAAHRAVALAPDDEPQLRRLLRILDELGDLTGANRSYQAFAEHAAAEFGSTPSAETQALIKAIRERSTPRARSSGQQLALDPADTEPAAADPAGPADPAEAIAPWVEVPPRKEPAPRRLAFTALAALAAAILLVVAWTRAHGRTGARQSALVAGAPIRLAILPARVTVGDSQLSRHLAEQLEIQLAARLRGDGAITFIDPEQVRVASGPSSMDQATDGESKSIRLGHAVHAMAVVPVAVVSTGDSALRASAVLFDVQEGRAQRQVEVRGRVDSFPAMVDRLAAALLAAVNGEPDYRLPTLEAVPVEALSAYLAGRRAYRLAQYDSAVARFARALAVDSSFALAGIGMADAGVLRFKLRPIADGAIGGWPGEVDTAWGVGTEAAWRARRSLSQEDNDYLVALRGMRAPQTATIREQLVAWEHVVTRDPGRAEAWFHFGNLLAFAGSAAGLTDAETRAVAALQRAAALEPSYVAPRLDLFELGGRAAEQSMLARYGAQILELSPKGDPAEYVRWRLALASGDARRMGPEAQAALDSFNTASLRWLVYSTQATGLVPGDASRAVLVLDRRSSSEIDGLTSAATRVMLALNEGRPAEADSIFDRSADLWRRPYWGDRFKVLYASNWGGDLRASAAVVRRITRGLASKTNYVDPAADQFVLTQVRLLTGDSTGARKLLAELRRNARTSADAADREWCATRADVIELMLAAVTHRPDFDSLLGRLDSLATARAPIYPATINLILARYQERAGSAVSALQSIRREEQYRAPEYLSAVLREDGRLSALVGDTSAALRAYRHYLILRNDPEPGARAAVDDVRQELHLLEQARR